MKVAVISAVVLSAILAFAPAHAQQQCPTCNIAAGSASGTCSNDATVTCKADADCVAAAVTAQCSCDGSTTHGQYTSCIARHRKDFKGCLSTPGASGKIQSCAARSTCGKAGRVLCCKVAGTGTCAVPTGGTTPSCSNTGAACSTDADCTVVTGPSWTHDASWCVAHGGYASGTGSKCQGCEEPVACCVPTTPGQPGGTCQVLSAPDCAASGGASTPGAAPTCPAGGAC